MEKDTICAPASATGGALSIIRVAGNRAIQITGKIFDKPLENAQAQSLHYGNITEENGETIDEVVVGIFRSPHSYTGEDIAEISCHGSTYITRKILQRLIDNGCRQALPGEFTQRAFENGKLDLAQAEAVADVIASTNRATHQMAMGQLKGHFSHELETLRNRLLHLTSLLELELDFSDHEELEFADRTELLLLAEETDRHILSLSRSFETGKALKEGIPVAIIGKTNVGKSTLLNRLIHEDKAIVSDIHGTTRDAIEDTTQIKGVTFRFIDTAGIRETADKVEQIGIELTYRKTEQARIILWLIDEMPAHEELSEIIRLTNHKRLIAVCNKVDLNNGKSSNPFENLQELFTQNGLSAPILHISAKLGTNTEELEQTIYDVADIPEYKQNCTIITSARHYEALTRAHESIGRVIDGLKNQLTAELIAEDLRLTLSQLGEITGGQITPPEVLETIFKHFCIGK
ncbi:MAG: tRNA uridine-5-carboxymethylaminomethyl(34) synthesis GTPase MnmE [Prevotella sp.]|nr:tRNA uridine-5-carboxymethylaminomethyl(34) synthesis GTPase MnmE [Prevotella sp.]